MKTSRLSLLPIMASAIFPASFLYMILAVSLSTPSSAALLQREREVSAEAHLPSAATCRDDECPHSAPLQGSPSTRTRKQGKAVKAAGPAQEPLAMMISFMLLRVAVALRSTYEQSPSILWLGIAFACFTRCICSEDVVGSTEVLADMSSLLASGIQLLVVGVRELLHIYGIRAILHRIKVCN